MFPFELLCRIFNKFPKWSTGATAPTGPGGFIGALVPDPTLTPTTPVPNPGTTGGGRTAAGGTGGTGSKGPGPGGGGGDALGTRARIPIFMDFDGFRKTQGTPLCFAIFTIFDHFRSRIQTLLRRVWRISTKP